MTMSRFFVPATSAALAAVLLSSTASLAAMPNGAAASPAALHEARHAGPQHAHGRPMPRQMELGRLDHIEGRIAFLKAELKITDDQSAQWEAVAKAMRDQAAAMTALREELRAARGKNEAGQDRAERRARLTAPQALELRERALATRARVLATQAEGERQFTAAFGALYDRLGDEQKKTADQLLTGRHRG